MNERPPDQHRDAGAHARISQRDPGYVARHQEFGPGEAQHLRAGGGPQQADEQTELEQGIEQGGQELDSHLADHARILGDAPNLVVVAAAQVEGCARASAGPRPSSH